MVKPLAAALTLVAVLLAGCGSEAHTPGDAGNAANGKALFTGEGQCGGCHTLADAGTQSQVGPNLDAAFAPLWAQGFDESTVRDVVHGQILYPTQNPAGFTREGEPAPGMPAKLVTGQDAIDVATYVASVAGRTKAGATPRATGGEALFTQNCGSCHTLAAANTAGTIGPSLDDLTPDAQRVERAMRQGPGQMPSFEGQLSDDEIASVAKFVADNAGG